MGVLSDEDLVVMRTRARHRLIGALALVVVLVVGLPLILDRHDPVPGPSAADLDGAHAGEEPHPATPLPDAMPPSRTPGGTPPAPSMAAASPDAGPAASPSAEGTAAAGAAGTGQAGPRAGGEAAHSASDGPPPAITPATTPGTESARTTPEPARAAAVATGPGGTAARTADAAAAPAAPAAAVAPPGTIPPIDIRGPGHHGEHGAGAMADAHARTPEPPHREAARQESGTAASPAAAGNAHATSAEEGARPAGGRGWYVQFGVFSEAARAETLARRLGEHGFAVHDEAIQGPRGSFRRVRAGPYSARGGADEVLARARALGENAILVHQ